MLLAIVSVVGQGLPQESRPYRDAQPSPLGTPERVYRDYVFGDGRVATVYERLAFTLPQEVRLLPDVEQVPTVLRSATQAYLPAGSGLAGTLLVGDVEPDLVVAGDAQASAERILPAVVARYRQGGGVIAEEVRIEPWPQVPGCEAADGLSALCIPDCRHDRGRHRDDRRAMGAGAALRHGSLDRHSAGDRPHPGHRGAPQSAACDPPGGLT